MRAIRYSIFLLVGLLSACAGPKSAGLFQAVREIRPDGKVSAPLADKDLSPFQGLLRQNFPNPPSAGVLSLLGKSSAGGGPQVAEIFAVEVDLPAGEGSEGGYLAVVREGKSAELRYYEQSDHRPRTDRYYHRPLTAEELAAFDEFLQAHPLAQMRGIRPVAVTNPLTTQPVVQPAEPTTEPETNATQPAPDAPANAPDSGDEGLTFRLTDARPGQAFTLALGSPVDPPAADLIALLRQMKNAGGFACTYVRAIPLTAKSMFADPLRKVQWVWDVGEDLRIGVGTDADGGAVQWLAYRAGRWEASAEPGTEAATEPAADGAATTQPAGGDETPAATATAPATTTAATEPVWDNPGMLPAEERWWTTAQTNATVVMHYVPLSPMHGVTHGFVVPGLMFDDEHFAVNAERGVLYLIHDGQLFSLEIPAGARQ